MTYLGEKGGSHSRVFFIASQHRCDFVNRRLCAGHRKLRLRRFETVLLYTGVSSKSARTSKAHTRQTSCVWPLTKNLRSRRGMTRMAEEQTVGREYAYRHGHIIITMC